MLVLLHAEYRVMFERTVLGTRGESIRGLGLVFLLSWGHSISHVLWRPARQTSHVTHACLRSALELLHFFPAISPPLSHHLHAGSQRRIRFAAAVVTESFNSNHYRYSVVIVMWRRSRSACACQVAGSKWILHLAPHITGATTAQSQRKTTNIIFSSMTSQKFPP